MYYTRKHDIKEAVKNQTVLLRLKTLIQGQAIKKSTALFLQIIKRSLKHR